MLQRHQAVGLSGTSGGDRRAGAALGWAASKRRTRLVGVAPQTNSRCTGMASAAAAVKQRTQGAAHLAGTCPTTPAQHAVHGWQATAVVEAPNSALRGDRSTRARNTCIHMCMACALAIMRSGIGRPQLGAPAPHKQAHAARQGRMHNARPGAHMQCTAQKRACSSAPAACMGVHCLQIVQICALLTSWCVLFLLANHAVPCPRIRASAQTSLQLCCEE